MKAAIVRLSALAVCVFMSVVAQAAPADLTLFGTKLKGASRDELRGVFKEHGLTVTRENDAYWVDKYDASKVLDGASAFEVGYVEKTRTFAYGEYTFQGFMNTELVSKVISMVQSKYGAPSTRSGSSGLGPVKAIWNLPNGMRITVSRGWPDTTTFLDYEDVAAYKAMDAEVNAEKQRQTQQKAAAQSTAF